MFDPDEVYAAPNWREVRKSPERMEAVRREMFGAVMESDPTVLAEFDAAPPEEQLRAYEAFGAALQKRDPEQWQVLPAEGARWEWAEPVKRAGRAVVGALGRGMEALGAGGGEAWKAVSVGFGPGKVETAAQDDQEGTSSGAGLTRTRGETEPDPEAREALREATEPLAAALGGGVPGAVGRTGAIDEGVRAKVPQSESAPMLTRPSLDTRPGPEPRGAAAAGGLAAWRGAGPAVAAMMGGGAAAEALMPAAAAAAPMVGPLAAAIPAVGGLVGAIVAGGVAAWGQNKAIDALYGGRSVVDSAGVQEDYRAALDRQMARDRQEHPWATFVGESAPLVLTARFEPQQVKRAVLAAAKLRGGAGLTPWEAQTLVNVGVGTGSQVGLEAWRQWQEGEVNPLRLVGEALLGAGMGAPRWAKQPGASVGRPGSNRGRVGPVDAEIAAAAKKLGLDAEELQGAYDRSMAAAEEHRAAVQAQTAELRRRAAAGDAWARARMAEMAGAGSATGGRKDGRTEGAAKVPVAETAPRPAVVVAPAAPVVVEPGRAGLPAARPVEGMQPPVAAVRPGTPPARIPAVSATGETGVSEQAGRVAEQMDALWAEWRAALKESKPPAPVETPDPRGGVVPVDALAATESLGPQDLQAVLNRRETVFRQRFGADAVAALDKEFEVGPDGAYALAEFMRDALAGEVKLGKDVLRQEDFKNADRVKDFVAGWQDRLSEREDAVANQAARELVQRVLAGKKAAEVDLDARMDDALSRIWDDLPKEARAVLEVYQRASRGGKKVLAYTPEEVDPVDVVRSLDEADVPTMLAALPMVTPERVVELRGKLRAAEEAAETARRSLDAARVEADRAKADRGLVKEVRDRGGGRRTELKKSLKKEDRDWLRQTEERLRQLQRAAEEGYEVRRKLQESSRDELAAARVREEGLSDVARLGRLHGWFVDKYGDVPANLQAAVEAQAGELVAQTVPDATAEERGNLVNQAKAQLGRGRIEGAVEEMSRWVVAHRVNKVEKALEGIGVLSKPGYRDQRGWNEGGSEYDVRMPEEARKLIRRFTAAYRDTPELEAAPREVPTAQDVADVERIVTEHRTAVDATVAQEKAAAEAKATEEAAARERAGRDSAKVLKKALTGFPKAKPVVQMMRAVVPKNATLPILSRVLVKDGIATATDLNMAIRMKTVLSDGLYQLVGKEFVPAPKGDDPDDFPPVEVVLGKVGRMRMERGKEFLEALEAVGAAASTDVTREVLNGVALRVVPGGVMLVATDDRRLHVRFVAGDVAGMPQNHVTILPSAAVKVLGQDGAAPWFEMAVDEKAAAVRSGNSELTTKLVEGTYPNWRQVVPAKLGAGVVFDRDEMLAALKTLMPFVKAGDRNGILVLRKGKKLTLRVSVPDKFEKEVSVAVTDAGEVVTGEQQLAVVMPMGKEEMPEGGIMALNAYFLEDAVKAVPGKQVLFGFQDELTPGIVQATGQEPAKWVETTPDVVEAQRAEVARTSGKNADVFAAAGGETPASGWADRIGGLGKPGAPVSSAAFTVFPVELPEAVELARALGAGRYPKLREALRGGSSMGRVMGRYHGGPLAVNKLEMRRDLFRLIEPDRMEVLKKLAADYAATNTAPEDSRLVVEAQYLQELLDAEAKSTLAERPALASHVLLHEIGHWIDDLPDWMIGQRGNILGRIASLHKFTKTQLPLAAGNPDLALEEKDRRELRKQAQKQVGPRPKESAPAGELKAWRDQVAAVYGDLVEAEAQKRGMVTRKGLLKELEPLSMWWRGEAEMTEYTSRPEEVYANAFSALMNNPAEVAKRAPKYYQAFFGWLEKKPEFKRLYDKLMLDVQIGTVQSERDRRQMEGQAAADRAGQAVEDEMRRMTPQEWRDVFMMAVDRRFAPAYRRAAQNPQAGAQGARARTAIGNWLYHEGPNRVYLMRSVAEVLNPLHAAGVPRVELNAYLENMHILHNRFDIASMRGTDAKAASEALAAQERRLGPEKWAALKAADEARWKIRNEEVLDAPPVQRMLSEENLANFKARRHYSTVSAVKTDIDPVEALFNGRYGGQVTPRIYRAVGYLGDARSPVLSTAQKDVSLLGAAYKNEVKLAVAELMQEIRDPLFRDADWRWDKNANRRVPVIVENDRVKTIVALDRGELKAWYVPAVVHDMIESSSSTEMRVVIDVLHRGTKAMKKMWTELNYGFWPFNYLRDAKGFVENMPHVYSRVFGKHSYRSYAGRAREAALSYVQGRPNAVALQALRRGMLIAVREHDQAGEQEAFERFLESHGVNPEAFGLGGGEVGRRSLWQKYKDVGRRMEAEFKIAGMLHVDEHPKLRGLPEGDKQRMVREYAGSPNFLERGTMNWLFDAAMPFFGAAKAGYRRSGTSYRDQGWRKVLKVARYSLLPKLLLAGGGSLLAQLFGEEAGKQFEEMRQAIPSWDKTNYDAIPLLWVDKEQGKVLYWRGVEEEEERILGGVMAKAMEGDWDPRDLLNFASGQLPGWNPLAGVVLNNWDFWVAERNPIERGRPIVDRTLFEAGYGGVEMAKWTANQVGAGLVTRFGRDNLYNPDPAVVERVLAWPVVSNTLGRFLRVSNAGLRQAAALAIKPALQEAARVRLKVRELAKADGGLSAEDGQWLVSTPGALEYYKTLTTAQGMRQDRTPMEVELWRNRHNPAKVWALQQEM